MRRTAQISLFDRDHTKREIKKHSSIVQIGSVSTLQERKAMNTLIWVAKDFLKRNPEQRSFTCDLGIIKRLAGLGANDNDGLKDVLRNLHNTMIEYNILRKDKKERGVFSFLAEVNITSG